MNLRLLLSVLGRFKYLVAAGLLLATAAVVISLVRVSFEGGSPRLEYRSEQRWQSTATLFVTQEGFPWGRSILDEVVPVGPERGAGYVPRYSDTTRFQTLAQLYAQLAMTDEVERIMLRDGPLEGEYETGPVAAKDGTFLPLVAVAGFGSTPEGARTIAQRATDAFLLYLRRTQEMNDIPADRRVDIQVVERPNKPTLVEGRRLTRPLFLFVLLTSATVLLAFALENLRPRSVPHAPTVAEATPVPTRLRTGRKPKTARKTA